MEGWRVSGRDQGAGDSVRGASDMPKGPHWTAIHRVLHISLLGGSVCAGAVAGVPRACKRPVISGR